VTPTLAGVSLPAGLSSRLAQSLVLVLSLACAVPGVDWHEQPRAPEPGLDARILTVVSWNTHKGRGAGFRDDLRQLVLAERPDLLFLQEARRELARPGPGLVLFAPSWRYPWPGGATVGVMTLSLLPAQWAQPMKSRFRELFVTAPKTSLLSWHTLADGRSLLAANVHLLVFGRFSTLGLANQLDALESALQAHVGPVVLAGDFNVWSRERLSLVESLAERIGLTEVSEFPEGRRTGDLGRGWTAIAGVDPELPLDRIYYRGLEPLDADVLGYVSSDHAPLRVSFALSAPKQPGRQLRASHAGVPGVPAEADLEPGNPDSQ
jgi:endonuclease/exonuclease/phosphatase (EEP) superfamily protein YafD